MERVLTNFIRALRASEVKVSPAEAIDAARAMALMGYGDRGVMRETLSLVLAKSEPEKEIHDRLFDLYFRADLSADAEDNDAADTQADAETDPPAQDTGEQQADAGGGGGGDDGEDNRPEDGDPSEGPAADGPPEDLLALLQSGDDTAIAMAIESAAQRAGINDIRFSTQVAYYAQQIVKEMGGEAMQAKLLDALQSREPGTDEHATDIIEARKDLTMRARARAEQAFDVFGAGETEQFRDEFAAEKAIGHLDARDLERMKLLVQKIAKRLAVKHSRKRKQRQRGQLDVRKTLRANAGHGGVPFEVSWRQKTRDRPKIVAICDVSGSVAQYVRFLLLLLYALNDVVPDIKCFAFSHRLKPVDDILEARGFEAAMKTIVNTVGMGSTSYGQALSDLKVEHWSAIDRRTTVIILGDGRSNYGDPRLDIFQELTARAKRTVWLCNEQDSLWGSGDSEMLRYQPYCSQLSHVKNLRDFERAVDAILATYA